MLAMIGLQILVTKGSQLGFTSVIGIVLIAATLLFSFIFFYIEKGKKGAFIDFKLFNNMIFTGATISNFLLNGTAGMLTLGYAIAIVLFIRMGEKLLQRVGARKPMIWGSLIVGVAIFLLMFTNVMTDTYKILAIIAYTLFGLGLAFYATPSTDAALSNLPGNQAGAGAGIYKMASSLGAAFGVAISAGVFAAFNVGDHIQWLEGVLTFVGRQDNVVVRQAAIIGLGVNLMMIVMAILFIMITIPKSTGKAND
jgi:DHA2 family multidrug resistance protein-like MFS transporter